MSETERLQEGHVIAGEFRVDALEMDGEYATTYRGCHIEKGVPVKIRTFDLARFLPSASLPMIKKRFVNEAHQLAGLLHENLETVLGAGEDGALVYLVTSPIDAPSLDKRIAEPPERKPVALVKSIVAQILAALEKAHETGHPHRDLSPARIHLSSDGSLKVADFALVKLLHTLRGTQEGISLLRPYAPPELVRGEEVGPKADLYAVGAIAFELLTGAPPFAGEGEDLRDAILERPLAFDAPAARELPPPLRAFLEKAMAKDPAARFKDAKVMSAAFGDVVLEPRTIAPEAATETAPAAAPAAATPPPATSAPGSPVATPQTKPAAGPPNRRSVVIVRRKGPSPAVAFGIAALLALSAGVLVFRYMPRADRGQADGDARPDTHTPLSGGPRASGETKAPQPTPPEGGLVHELSTPEPQVVHESFIEGIDIDKLTQAEKEALLEKIVAEVNSQIAQKNGDEARRLMEELDKVAPNDPRFYELESKALALSLVKPHVPSENEEVPLVTVDEAPSLVKHHPPRFPKRKAEDDREVVVKAQVDAGGKVTEAMVLVDDEWGDGRLAVETVKSWEFDPAKAKGVKVRVWIAIPIRTGGEWKKPEVRLVAP